MIPSIVAAKGQMTHPSVKAAYSSKGERRWKGGKYYLAYTPYPFQNSALENPCIAVSDDGTDWKEPEGIANPVATNYETNCDELKDPELVYNSDKNEMELWYLGRIDSCVADDTPLHLFRKRSLDGVHWSEREVVLILDAMKLVSPMVLYEKGRYRFWGVHADEQETAFYYSESADCRTWTPYSRVFVQNAVETKMWHGDVCRLHDRLFLVWCSKEVVRNRKSCLYLAESSDDGRSFSGTRVIVRNDGGWMHFYRPTILLEDGLVLLYYGLVTKDNRWYVGMSRGKSINSLEPVNGMVEGFCVAPWNYRRVAVLVRNNLDNRLLVLSVVLMAMMLASMAYTLVNVLSRIAV